MSLPKIDVPVFEMKWPSKNKDVKFRPFLVKEEKILLIAQESGTDKDITLAIKQVLNNCITDQSFNVDELTTFDLEYMFIKLRSKSVSDQVKLTFNDNEDSKDYHFNIKLDEIELQTNPDHNRKIEINEKTGIMMKYPSVNIVTQIPEDASYLQVIDYLILKCIDYVYDEDTITKIDETNEKEVANFLDALPVDVYQKMKTFFETAPHIVYTIKYKNSLDHDREITLRNLRDFFIWG